MARKPELGKWLLWRHFAANKELRPYLPATAPYSRGKLQSFLNAYRTVYVKPQAGSRGIGIFKIWKTKGQVSVKHTIRPTRTFTSLSSAMSYIDGLRGNRGYIVQRGIQLAKFKGRVFDVRVMVQKTKPGGEWMYSGMLAKIAGPGSVVTNVALSKGRVLGFEDALSQSLGLSTEKIGELREKLIHLSLVGARHFDKYQPYREIGFDWAVDRNGGLWLLEENTGPSHRLFAKLKSNRKFYRTIQRKWSDYQSYVKQRDVRKDRKQISSIQRNQEST